MPNPANSFLSMQRAFAQAVRGHESDDCLRDIPAERMDLYRELIFRNLNEFLAGGFPVLHDLLAHRQWDGLVRDFLLNHRCSTPYFHGIAAEFLDFLQSERGIRDADPPFLLELAHYEWVELAVALAEQDAPAEDPAALDDPLSSHPVLAASAWPLVYRYPVHKIGRDHRPDEPPQDSTFLTVYRDRADQVHFLEINAVTHRLLCLIRDEPGQCARAQLDWISVELNYPDTSALHRFGIDLLRDLMRRGVIGNV